MRKFRKLTIGMIGAVLLSAGLYSCNNDDPIENETVDNSKKAFAKNSGFHLEKIDNGLDGQILFFDSAEAYINVQENLVNKTNAYLDSYQERIPRDVNDDKLEEYLNGIGYNEDIIYEEFEKSIGFNSFRTKLNNDIEKWLDRQTNPERINEEGDPDSNTLVLESDRALYNVGGEVVVLDSLKNPVIYKAFDWGHLVVEKFDTDIIKTINVENLKTLDQVKSKFTGKSHIKFKIDFTEVEKPCMTDNVKDKKHVYSANGQHNVKSIIKNRKTPFDNSGKHDRLIIKTKGYKWKRGKWRNRAVWLVNGFTSKRNQHNLPITWWMNFCDSGSSNTKKYELKPKCVRKFEYNGGGPMGNIAYKDNSIYAFHGEGTFTFTVDFYGTKNSGHEVHRITN